MKKHSFSKLEAITPNTLIVGVDIAKNTHWARFTDYRGIPLGKALKVSNNKAGFKNILTSIKGVGKQNDLPKVILGLEPTGHYWKPLANYLVGHGIKVVLINPYHTKKAKELDDNSPTKNDKKDALTIARLLRDGRFSQLYLPQDVFSELRVLSSTRVSLLKRQNAIKNTIRAVLDEYFPELVTVFKYPFKGKACRQILKSCPFPSLLLKLGRDKVLTQIKKAVQKTIGQKRVEQLFQAAQDSIGVNYGIQSARLKLTLLIEELELMEKQLDQLETAMEQALTLTGFKEIILSIPGVGIVTAASFLGNTGDPLRFTHPRQISKLAGYNLTEDSSGENKSKTTISKRGRKQLRNVLYQMARTTVAVNSEMKTLYHYLKTRPHNPLKKKQALVVISKKIITIIHSLLKKQTQYQAELVFNQFRKNQLKQVA
ncbi:MAG TPA: IS110 family transposase [Candidatus Atribacteria bacterium]|nr:IS110 family transposase [Candidatus Atribacteria bacterium]